MLAVEFGVLSETVGRDPIRRKGAPVFFVVEAEGRNLRLYLCDEKGQWLPDDTKFVVNFDLVEGIEDAQLQAMAEWDEFVSWLLTPSPSPRHKHANMLYVQARQIHAYNLGMAVYHVRDRLTHWANGFAAHQVPNPRTRFGDTLRPVVQCRHAKRISGVAAGVLGRLRESCEPSFL